MKTKILWCTESTVLKTGYSVYSREVLSRLYASNKFEIAEFASYIHHKDKRLQGVPWKVYANLPDDDPEQQRLYNSVPSNQFGEWRFDSICIDFNPTIVVEIRDFWMGSHEDTSPLRKYYNFIWMPTVDAPHQHEQWLSTYANCDAIFTYQDWSLELLKHEGGGKINVLTSAPPSASKEFQPHPNKSELKKNLGLDGYKIFGTVMRNQRRKLFPDLFKSFRQFLNKTEHNDVLLYCHTSYPDNGWDFPALLNEYGLYSKVLFTYVCNNCHHSFPSFFSDMVAVCTKCGKKAANCASVQNGVDNNTLSTIINLFDFYMQISSSEGCGVPQIEAAACGVPIIAVDFSAMTDVVRKLGGIPVKVLTTQVELETGCLRAIPDNNHMAEIFNQCYNMSDKKVKEWGCKTRKNFETHYRWDQTTKKWGMYFDSIDRDKYDKLWHSQPRLHTPSTNIPKNCTNSEFAKWLIVEVLGEPDRLNTYMEVRLTRDLNHGATTMGMSGMYFNDMSNLFSRPQYKKFGREEAYDHMVELCNRRNMWEKRRWQSVQK